MSKSSPKSVNAVKQSQINQIKIANYADSMKRITQGINNLNITDDDPIYNFGFNFTPKIQKEICSKTKRCHETKKIDLFLSEILENAEYDAETITGIYNSSLATDITNNGFGKLKVIKEKFNVIKRKEKGKFKTYYILK